MHRWEGKGLSGGGLFAGKFAHVKSGKGATGFGGCPSTGIFPSGESGGDGLFFDAVAGLAGRFPSGADGGKLKPGGFGVFAGLNCIFVHKRGVVFHVVRYWIAA